MEPRNYGETVEAGKKDDACFTAGNFAVCWAPDHDMADRLFVYRPGTRTEATDAGLVVTTTFTRAHTGASEWEQL